MASSVPWTELEDYRQLLQEYEQRTSDYEQRLNGYRQDESAGGDPQTLEQIKAELDQELSQLQELYRRLEVMRKDLARTRDAVV